MSHRAHTLDPALQAALSDALAEALIEDPFYRAVSDTAVDEAARRMLLHHYFAAALDEARAVGALFWSENEGAALWMTDEEPEPAVDAARNRRKDAMSATLGEAGLTAYTTMAANMAANLPEATHDAWYLSVLGVRPAARGRGLAAELLAPTLTRANAAGRGCYLETFNPRSVPFYQRLGFGIIATATEPHTGALYRVMYRAPTPTS